MPISNEILVAFTLTCFVIEVTPGPNMAYLAVLSVIKGRRAGYAATAGIALGLMIVGFVAALGLAALISNSYLGYEMLRWGGVAYLFWLAWDGWQDTSEISPINSEANEAQAKFFTRGLITNLLNPKAAVFYIAVLPTFVDQHTSVLAQTVTLSIIYVFVATIIHGTIVSLAGTVRPLLETPGRRRLIRRALSLILVGIAIWFAYATKR